jgi:hypothetical protein
MANNFIVNRKSNKMLGVAGANPVAGAGVQLFALNTNQEISAYWVINNVEGGQFITLLNSPNLCLDINADNLSKVVPDTLLILSDVSSPKFPGSNLWSTSDISKSLTATWSPIISLCGAFMLVAAGSNSNAKVEYPANSDSVKWVITTIAEMEGDVNTKLIF